MSVRSHCLTVILSVVDFDFLCICSVNLFICLSQKWVWGQVLWHSKLSHCLGCLHLLLECQFKSQLVCFYSNFLLKHPGRQQMMAQVLPQDPPPMWEIPREFCTPGYIPVCLSFCENEPLYTSSCFTCCPFFPVGNEQGVKQRVGNERKGVCLG